MVGVGDCTFHPTDAILKGKEGDACEPVCIFLCLHLCGPMSSQKLHKITLGGALQPKSHKVRRVDGISSKRPETRVLRNSASA